MKNNWPDNLIIQQYLEGSLDKKLMHELEKRALEDPFLADAMEGYSAVSTEHGLSILQRQLHERISHQQENKKVFNLTWQRLSVAAAAAVMFISAGILFWMNSELPDKKTAAKSNRVEANIAPVESLALDGPNVSNTVKKPATLQRSERPPLHSEKRYNRRPIVESKVIASDLDQGEIYASQKNSIKNEAVRNEEVQSSARQLVSEEGLKTSKKKGNPREVQMSAAPEFKLSEVAVNGFVAGVPIKVSPVEGWEVYERYLKENLLKASAVLQKKGKVILGFQVNELGDLNNFKVLQGLSPAADSLAIQIIKAGPRWKPASEGKVSDMEIELDF